MCATGHNISGVIWTNDADVPDTIALYIIIVGDNDTNSGRMIVGGGRVAVGETTTTMEPTTTPSPSVSPETASLTTAEIVLISVGGVALVLIVLVIVVVVRRRRKKLGGSLSFAEQTVQGTVSQTYVD